MRDAGLMNRNCEQFCASPGAATVVCLAPEGGTPFAHYFSELEDLTDFIEVDLELDDELLDPDAWGEHSLMIEDWFAAGEDLEDAADWAPLVADGWTDGMVMTRPTGGCSGAGRATTILRG